MDDISHIESAFVEYSEIINAFGKSKIEARYKALLREAEIFIDKMEYQGSVIVDRIALLYAVLDYFSDILRLKHFHEIYLVEEDKIIAYSVYWILKRMPLQKITSNDEIVFANERFALSHVIKCLIKTANNEQIFEINFKEIKFFTETLFYALKFRSIDARSLELIILAFKAGLMCLRK